MTHMIKLFAFGPNFGLPDPSPFCMKVMVLLKMADLPYEFHFCDPRKAPKGKGPFIVDDGETIPDSTLIRWHLEQKYGHDFDAGLDARQRAVAWAIEKLCEDNLYWALLSERWSIDKNFNAGPKVFFERIPMPLRLLVVRLVRKDLLRNLYGQGLGRHSREDVLKIADAGMSALDAYLGDNAFMMGDKPSGVDAIAFSTVAGCLPRNFDTPLTDMVRRRPRLSAYQQRCMRMWFPEFSLS